MGSQLGKFEGERMTDNEFLQWIYDRMVNVYNENELFDYMQKFRGIIEKGKE
jgi:hypothetical protein